MKRTCWSLYIKRIDKDVYQSTHLLLKSEAVGVTVQQVSTEIVDYNKCPGGVPVFAWRAANEAVYLDSF
jgi:hypothetical protein